MTEPVPGSNRVCVIGAGIAGLVMAKVLAGDGFAVTVYEKEPAVGGVWAPARTYPGLRANNPRETYCYSDLPFPKGTEDFPTAEQMRGYFKSYIEKFRLAPYLKLGLEVVRVERRAGGAPGYDVTTREVATGTEATETFDYIAICNGTFSRPKIPDLPGREQFAGRVLHSSQMMADKIDPKATAVVVGAGKSALDCAATTAKLTKGSTLVFRAPHWMVPRYFFGFVRVDYIILTRFSESFLRYHKQNAFERFLHGPGRSFLWLWWRGYERLIPALLDVPPILTPETPLPGGLESIGIGPDLNDVYRQGKLKLKRGEVASFTKDGVVLSTGEELKCDLAAFATGWHQEVDFLSAELLARVKKDGRFHLYRYILPPEEPRIGFNGYASSGACQLSSEIGAHWLSQVWRGEMVLPDVSGMNDEIDRVRRWLHEVLPVRTEGYFVGPYLAHYLDELMDDMRLRTLRTSNFYLEHMFPLLPSRYADVADERKDLREGGRPRAKFYLSGPVFAGVAGVALLAWLVSLAL